MGASGQPRPAPTDEAPPGPSGQTPHTGSTAQPQDSGEQPASQAGQATPEEFENDPARNPDDETLKNLKGG